MKLEILYYPDKRLYNVAAPVEKVDEQATQLVEAMLKAMYAAKGIGLAATQVNIQKRVIVIDVSETRNQPLVLINPKIVKNGQERLMGQEGCLSVPDLYDDIERWDSVVVEALDKNGKLQKINADGLLGRCIQHEIDHLDGKMFVDYLSPLKRNRIKTKMQKRIREEKRSDQVA